MHVLVAKNYDAMSRAAADIVEHQIQAEPQALISFPGGKRCGNQWSSYTEGQ